MARKPLPAAGFKAPNHTQVPNDFFEMLPDMGEAELRVTLVMLRWTFGYHQVAFRMGIKEIAEATGLSESGVRMGAEAAESRGTFRRVNPDSKEKARWELIVTEPLLAGGSPAGGTAAGGEPLLAGGEPLLAGGQSGVKETIKETSKERIAAPPDDFTRVVRELEKAGIVVTAMTSDTIRGWLEHHTPERIAEAIRKARMNGVRRMGWVDAVLDGWKANGYPKAGNAKTDREAATMRVLAQIAKGEK